MTSFPNGACFPHPSLLAFQIPKSRTNPSLLLPKTRARPPAPRPHRPSARRYVERTILEDLERSPEGLEPLAVKKCLWQLLRSIQYCHSHSVRAPRWPGCAARALGRRRLSQRCAPTAT